MRIIVPSLWGFLTVILNVFKVISIVYRFFSFTLNQSPGAEFVVTRYIKEMPTYFFN